MGVIDVDWAQIEVDLIRVALAFALAFPIAWERGRGRASIGLRTLPIVAMAACGFALIIRWAPSADAESQARVLQGIITGIGFIGGGAIVKQGTDVRGLVTAASIWNAGAIGVAVGYGRADVGIVLSITNMLVLLILKPVAEGRQGDE
ncbi:MgtC/SapB family protein [Microvirga sp. BT688]|uniref:MgtC/SapB family protein n=1 Tax=Microvirga sp. TaxID=1873136 RepID=UPI001688F4CD|nr:MgtC/SapB family protein [Microvirga sp.]MBD2749918.1 MgtC/SapB family protein [Microvirga sp.]